MSTFQIYSPVKPFHINQAFGVNGAYYQAHGINIIGHNGQDLEAYHGQPIYASHNGIAYYEVDENQGHGVVIITNDQFDFQGSPTNFKSIYWHMCDSSKEPQFKSPVENNYPLQVKTGDLIGYADNTGLSQGDHVHWGIKPVAKQNEAPFAWINTQQNNGYMGCVDPTPYFNGLYAQDINKVQHTFYIQMKSGDTGPEVMALQKCLQSIGYFPSTQDCTGFYGSITASAVFQFQKDYLKGNSVGLDVIQQVWELLGRRVGPFTLSILNKQFQ